MIEEFRKQLREPRIIIKSNEKIDFREFFPAFFEVSLNETSGDDQLLELVFLVFRDIQDVVYRFLFGGKDESARIDDDDVAFPEIIFIFEERIIEKSHDVLAVDKILCASK